MGEINQTMQGSGDEPAFTREEIRTAAGYDNDDEEPLGEEDGDEEDEAHQFYRVTIRIRPGPMRWNAGQ